jgi:hypothetical protein
LAQAGAVVCVVLVFLAAAAIASVSGELERELGHAHANEAKARRGLDQLLDWINQKERR